MTALPERLLAPLNSVFEALPFAAARPAVVGFLLAAALVPLFLSRDFVLRGAPDRSALRDLRWWALVVMAPYLLIYALL